MLVNLLRSFFGDGISLKAAGSVFVIVFCLAVILVNYLVFSRLLSGDYKLKLKEPRRRLGIYLPVIAVGLIVNYLCLVLFYALSPTFSDQIEPTIAAISWLFYKGGSMYPPLDTPQRYVMLYGPILYIFGGFLLGLFQPTIFTIKLIGVLPAIGSIFALFYAFRKMVDIKILLICLGFISLIVIAGPLSLFPAIFWARPDPLILFLVSLSLLGIMSRRFWMAGLIYGICVGLAINLKIHAFLYFLPFLFVLKEKHGVRSALISLIISIVVFIAPFLVFQQIVIQNYILLLFRLFSGQGFGFIEVSQNLIWSSYLIIPNLLMSLYLFMYDRETYRCFFRQNRIYFYTLLMTFVAVLLFASVKGGGMNHLIPLVPAFIYYFILLLKQVLSIHADFYTFVSRFKLVASVLVSVSFTLVLVSCVLAFSNEVEAITLLTKSSAPIIEDLNQIMLTNPNTTIEMGYGDLSTYEKTFVRPILVFAGNPYSFDAPALMVSISHSDLPSSSLTLLKTCQTKIWLIPKGSEPFTLSNLNSDKPLFDERFRETFLKHYQLRESTAFFDLWQCKID